MGDAAADETRCPICTTLTFGQPLCWHCTSFREYAEGARALCDGLHRGQWPTRVDAPAPVPVEVDGP